MAVGYTSKSCPVHGSSSQRLLLHIESTRWIEDRRLLGLIKQSWLESGAVYGYRKVHCDLRELGECCGKHRVARLMKQEGRAIVVARFSLRRGLQRFHRIICSNNSMLLYRIVHGLLTLPTSALTKAGCIWPLYWIYFHGKSSVGRCRPASPATWY